MTIGVLLYVFYRQCELLHPYGAELRAVITTTQPWLIFLMLYSSFCKVQLSCLRLRRHFLLPLLISVCAFSFRHSWPITFKAIGPSSLSRL